MVVLHSSDPSEAGEEIDGLQENRTIAKLLAEIAELLEVQQASEFRVRAYRAAADTINGMPTPLRSVFKHDGIDGLIALPTIGQSIANLVQSYLRLGHMPLLDRLRGEVNAESFFTTLPGIGPELSHRIHEHLHVETLPELFAAARRGRLENVPGLGRKRIRAIRDSLAQQLGKNPDAAVYPESDRSVSVAELLSIDEEYRTKAAAGTLTQIAPSSFNPGKIAWLPILHASRNGRHYTALFSNTARAHQLKTTHDWVVVFRDDTQSHGRWTIITSQFGRLNGYRIVRGREDECETFYRIRRTFHPPVAGHPPPPELRADWDDERN